MITNDVGFVVKSFFPQKQKICLITRGSGKILLAVRLPNGYQVISVGSLVECCLQSANNIYISNRIEVLFVPIEQAKCHIYWIHHILEICYYFAPLHAPCAELFCFLQDVYRVSLVSLLFPSDFDLIKKIVLLKLFELLGFYPKQEYLFLLGYFDVIRIISIDSSNNEKVRSLHALLANISDKMIDGVDAWLLQCLYEHPNAISFKTITFFDVL